jgi:two-component system cell cycle sensor histidine kinase/response regulator CckA
VSAQRFPRGIRDKLLLSFSALVAGIALFVVLFFPARLELQAMRGIAAKADAIRDIAAQSLAAPLVFGDTTAAREVANSTSADREVSSFTVRDAAGQILVARGDTTPAPPDDSTGSAESRDRTTWIAWMPVFHESRRVGAVTIGFSLAGVRADVATARRAGLVMGLLIFLVGSAVVMVISTYITRPLTDVARTVNLIASGDLTRRAVEPPDEEVARLVRPFNAMVDGLVAAQSDLSRINGQLEARVLERTQALRETSETLQSLVDLAPQAIIAADESWLVTRWNQAAQQLFGWTADEVMGKPVPFVPPEKQEDFMARKKSYESGEGAPLQEVEYLHRDGRRLTVLVAASAQHSASGAMTGFIAVVTDLTERKSLETQLHQAQKMEAMGRLAGGVAHDFNNVLTVVTMSAAMLQDGTLTDEQREEVEEIRAAALRATALTRQLLTFSRRQIVKLEPLSVNAVIRDMDGMLHRLLRADIEFTTSLDPEAGEVVADAMQLQQVVMNLVVNASDAMPAGGILRVTTAATTLDDDYVRAHAGAVTGRHVRLDVTDNGVGMTPATIARIFEPFFTTKAVDQGTGLGLATTYAVVTHVGGHVTVDSKPGLGTTFHVYLPVREVAAVIAEPEQPRAPDAMPRGSETVLLVEDNNDVRHNLLRTLQRLGYTVLEAENGEAALALAAAHDGVIGALVTDLMMPGMNGRALADRIALERPDIGVVFISGYNDDTVNRAGIVGETRQFLQKPFTPLQIADALRTVLSGMTLALV